MPFFSERLTRTIDCFFAPPKAATQVIAVNGGGAVSASDLPRGFFRVQAGDKKTLGYNGSFYCLNCGATVVDGGKRITLEAFLDERKISYEELPLVKLPGKRATGAPRIGGHSFVDTGSFDDFDGEFIFDPLR